MVLFKRYEFPCAVLLCWLYYYIQQTLFHNYLLFKFNFCQAVLLFSVVLCGQSRGQFTFFGHVPTHQPHQQPFAPAPEASQPSIVGVAPATTAQDYSKPEKNCVVHEEEQCHTTYEHVCEENELCLEITEQDCQPEDVEICLDVVETKCDAEEREVCLDVNEVECHFEKESVDQTDCRQLNTT